MSLPIVLLHGLFGDRDNLRALASRLEADRQVLRLDLPGHGDAPATTLLSFAAMADDIAGRVDEAMVDAGLEGDASIHLVGHSLGGKIAMMLAARPAFAARLASLVVLDIAPRAYAPHHRPLIDALLGVDLDAIGSRRDADQQLAPHIDEAGVRAFLLKGLAREGDSFRWRYDLAAIDRDYESHLAVALPAPGGSPATLVTQFIAGGDSDYITAEDEPAIRARFQAARIDVIDGTGHWLHAERPDAVATLIERTVTEAERDAAS